MVSACTTESEARYACSSTPLQVDYRCTADFVALGSGEQTLLERSIRQQLPSVPRPSQAHSLEFEVRAPVYSTDCDIVGWVYHRSSVVLSR
jgi:hypothetical protein